MCIDLIMKIAFCSSLLLVACINLYNIRDINKLKSKVKDLSMDLDIHRELVLCKFGHLNERSDLMEVTITSLCKAQEKNHEDIITIKQQLYPQITKIEREVQGVYEWMEANTKMPKKIKATPKTK